MSSSFPVPNLANPFSYETYLFDADGVLWRANETVPGAVTFVKELLEMGKRVYIVTNNSTNTTEEYVKKVTKLGFETLHEANIISPNVVMVDYLRRHPHYTEKGRVYAIASGGVVDTLHKELGVECIGGGPDHVPLNSTFLNSVDVSKEVSAVVVGYDPHFSYNKIMKAANYLLNPSCGFFITNEDATFPGSRKDIVVPGTGSITASIRAVALPRQPIVFGKPGEKLQNYLRESLDLKPEQTIMLGDRLDTDISFGNRLGVATCWMRTGVHKEDDVKRAIEAKDTDLIPTYTFSFEEFYAN
ncbi:hypothetical protein PRIPAC_70423 [Pristionchus pacificus]|uniref:Hydrolase n=1 Tax=Pristionchus pacificus TaxID=54126 RepID=A0A454XLI3_PRIPA|nr:hypothetical protein PRIPAC_70423 [Pristionchus pacificus]|eukprot:PDM77107.1 hydrolase [Pristionchus pacificus]